MVEKLKLDSVLFENPMFYLFCKFSFYLKKSKFKYGNVAACLLYAIVSFFLGGVRGEGESFVALTIVHAIAFYPPWL